MLDLSGATWVEPPAIGDLVGALLDVDWLLAPVVDGPDLGLIVASTLDGSDEQDLCTPTALLAPAPFRDPAFDAGPGHIDFSADGFELAFEDAHISGALTVDRGIMNGVRLVGDIDTRPLVDLVDPAGGDDAVCVLMRAFGVSCVPCSDGGPYCLAVDAREMTAIATVSPVVERSPADIDADPACR